jgi:hypothetical protein
MLLIITTVKKILPARPEKIKKIAKIYIFLEKRLRENIAPIS